MKPYYQAYGTTIYCGDAREIVPQLGRVDTIITDPVWPNCPPGLLAGSEDPYGLLAATLEHAEAERVVIHLGCNSDPRFLNAVPERWPFLRVCWLRYSRPGYVGRLLNGGDVAYAFGNWPKAEPGAHLIPGEMVVTDSHDGRNNHPTPRRLEMVKWLTRWYAKGIVLDPFMGSGTTLVAARAAGYPAIGIEINPTYCDIAIARLAQIPLEVPA